MRSTSQPKTTAEEISLEESRERSALEALGPLPQRTPVGHGSRRLQRARHSVGLFPARSRALSRVPLGRRRPGRNQRPAPEDLLRRWRCGTGAIRYLKERLFGLTGKRGQSRRRREGILLLSGFNADAFLHEISLQISASRISIRATRGRKSPPRKERSGIRADRHGHFQRRPLLRRGHRIRKDDAGRYSHPDHRAQSRSGSGRPASVADGVVPQHLVVGFAGQAAH